MINSDAIKLQTSPIQDPPPVLRGFEHVTRYWDRYTAQFAAKILPGEYYVTQHGELIVTVLGSCVSACIRCKATGFGGMNHFMLPENRSPGPLLGTGRERGGTLWQFRHGTHDQRPLEARRRA